ncbi:MAG TPA: ATP-binding protein [Woeseiaceae bacterium]|nr:ATP-binding protein [Woeseiaceae bacterium]
MTFRLWHLALLLAVTTTLTTIGGVAATWWVADREFRDVLDDDLEAQTKLLAELLSRDKLRMTAQDLQSLLVETFEDDDEETLWVTVHDLTTGRRISNLDQVMPLAAQDDGSLHHRDDNFDWHGYQEREEDVVVQLLRRDDLYKEVQEEILEDIISPALVGGGINLLLLAVLILLILVPLTRLVRQLETRSADSLAPLSVSSPTREIRMLRDSLNNLMRGIDTVITRERRFASDVAHELRTPLTTLKLELASSTPDLPAMKSEVERLTRLIEQLLTLARLEGGQWRQRFDRLPLADICTRVIERFREKFLAAGMICDARLTSVEVAGDALLLEILLQNLLQNALNHCPSGTRVEVDLEKQGDTICLRVSDNGPGIPGDTRDRMSRGFTRLDSKSEGFGLGLAICHRIAEVHGAVIQYLAREDGRVGLVVEVSFSS